MHPVITIERVSLALAMRVEHALLHVFMMYIIRQEILARLGNFDHMYVYITYMRSVICTHLQSFAIGLCTCMLSHISILVATSMPSGLLCLPMPKGFVTCIGGQPTRSAKF